MDKPTEEQIKELWEYFGLTYFDGWFYDTKRVMSYDEIPDLNNLFKYAVPKLGLVTLQKADHHKESVATVVDYQNEKHGRNINEDPALALFWAIWEVIHG